MSGREDGKGGKMTFKEKASIKFVEQDEPDFIKAMKAKMGYRAPATIEDKLALEEDEDIPDTVEAELLRTKEEERPQVVVLNPETDLCSEDLQKALDDEKKKDDQRKINEGRITFKKPVKRGADGKEIDNSVEEKKKKIEQAKQPERKIEKNLLSFGDDEDEE